MALDRWRDDLGTLHDRFVPIGCRTSTRGSSSRESWEKCLSACVLYDPPETQLLKFADLVSLGPLGPIKLCPHCSGVGQVPEGTPLKVEDFIRDLSGMPSRARTERLANLELEAEALLEHYAGMAREGLEAYTPEDKHDAYRALRLRMVAHPDGRMEAEGVFIPCPGLRSSELARVQ